MSLCHRSDHAAAWSANTAAHPSAAAFCEAATADASGLPDVRAVSTPTNFVSSYDVPDFTGNLTASVAVRLAALAPTSLLVALTPLPRLSVAASVPAVPSVSVAKFTFIEACDPLTAPPPVCTNRRAPAPSIRSVTVAGPFQCGTIVMRTAVSYTHLRAH